MSPRWQQALGTTAEETFAALYEDPARLRQFCQFMDAFSIPIGQEIAERFDFTPYRCVMDVADGLSDRFKTQTADLLKGPHPSGADVIMLSWILHDWSDENCRKILRNCFAALPSKGVLLISESVLNNDFSGTPFGVFLSLHMLVVCESGAKERTEAEYQSLLEEAGFRDIELIRLDAPRDLIIGRKP